MKVANIVVNLPVGSKEYDAAPGETMDEIVERAEALHPDWTSAMVVIVNMDR